MAVVDAIGADAAAGIAPAVWLAALALPEASCGAGFETAAAEPALVPTAVRVPFTAVFAALVAAFAAELAALAAVFDAMAA